MSIEELNSLTPTVRRKVEQYFLLFRKEGQIFLIVQRSSDSSDSLSVDGTQSSIELDSPEEGSK